MATQYNFTVVLNKNTSEDKTCTINCMFDIFSLNIEKIHAFASTFGCSLTGPNTVIAPSEEAFIAMVNQLMHLTIPLKLSENQKR